MMNEYSDEGMLNKHEDSMAIAQHRTLEAYLALEYPFDVKADPDGGYAVSFPDLVGCFTQVDDLTELPAAVAEARALWLETAYEQGVNIPLPSYPEEAGGKVLLRMPKSLHGRLLAQARREGVSLNQYAVSLLARGDARASIEDRLARIEQQLRAISPSSPLRENVSSVGRAR